MATNDEKSKLLRPFAFFFPFVIRHSSFVISLRPSFILHPFIMATFPYLIISDANASQFTRLAAARHGHTTGYKGYQKPGKPHRFQAGRPMGPSIPRSQWTARINAGQGEFLSDLVKQKGIAAKDQNGLGHAGATGARGPSRCSGPYRVPPHLTFRRRASPYRRTHWRNMGGYASEAFDQLQSGGACE